MIRFFCFVYGPLFTELFERIAVRSLTQTRNAKAIPHDAVIALYSDADSIARVSMAAELLGCKIEPHIVTIDGDTADVQNRVFVEEVGRCYIDKATMVIVGPENYWGDGSLGNLLAIAGQQNVCIAAPHVRVDRDKFLASLLPNGNIDNPALVSLSMQALHPSWIEANAERKMTSSFNAGISIREIGPRLYAVTHRLPTCWLARFTPEDVAFFQRNPQGRGLWDHAWPQMLIRSERQRVIGSSDAFFVAELTDKSSHNVALMASNANEPDAYCQPSLHASVNRNLTAVWRGV